MDHIFKEPLVCFDIDDTIVSWACYDADTDMSTLVEFTVPASGKSFWLEVITEHVDAVKSHKLRGHTIIFWSAGGAEWAKEVASKLGLSTYVDAYMAKPSWFYDDIPSSSFMPESNRRHARLKDTTIKPEIKNKHTGSDFESVLEDWYEKK